MKWIPLLLILVTILGCSSKQVRQLAIETVENAKVSLTAAENVGAHDVAVTEINSATEMLVNAESALQAGDVERAYRLALRAYLYARIATEKSLAVLHEAQGKEAQAELELQQQATEEMLNNLEKLRTELAATNK